MGRSSYWNFFPIVGILFQTLSLSDCEMYVIWFLGKEGTKRISEIANTPHFFPKPNLDRMSLPDDNMEFRLKDIPPTYVDSVKKHKFKMKRPPNYSNSAIYYAVDRLEKMGLTETISRKPRPKAERKVGLTFIGLMLYLQNSKEKNRFTSLFSTHSRLFPFSHLWKTLETKFGKDLCFSALEKTIKNFHALEKIVYVKSPDKFQFEAFNHKYSEVDLSMMPVSELFWLMFQRSDSKIKTQKADIACDFLKEKEACLLRQSYIAYLAAQDMTKLVDLDNKSYDNRLPQLKSEKELADFEQREVMANPLFKGKRLNEFFPKYSGIEYFFTGMFVNNLLWNNQ
jgi:hypothetical protein